MMRINSGASSVKTVVDVYKDRIAGGIVALNAVTVSMLAVRVTKHS